jgi:hypothetical protein
MKSPNYKRQLNELAKENQLVRIHNHDTHDHVFIVDGHLKKEGNAYIVRETERYVSFNNCKSMSCSYVGNDGDTLWTIWV